MECGPGDIQSHTHTTLRREQDISRCSPLQTGRISREDRTIRAFDSHIPCILKPIWVYDPYNMATNGHIDEVIRGDTRVLNAEFGIWSAI